MNPELVWRRAAACNTGACVEVATTDTAVHVRDSKNRDQAPLTFTHDEWQTFVDGVFLGEFDL